LTEPNAVRYHVDIGFKYDFENDEMVDVMPHITLLSKEEEFVDLVGRRPTIPIKEKVIEIIKEAPNDTVFYFDLNEVREVNGSGIHEVIVKPMEWLYQNYKQQNKYLVLKNLSEEYDHLYNIQITCNKEKVSVLAQHDDSFVVIGDKAGEALLEVLSIVYRQKQVSAREIVDALDKKHTLITTHLTKLYELRLVNRHEEQLEEGGRQYIYSSLF
jgi:DNA-binding transcriptional ArsR family regulator